MEPGRGSLAGKRERGRAVDDRAPKTSPAPTAFVSRLRDMRTASCDFSVGPGFSYEPISSTRDAFWSPGPPPSDRRRLRIRTERRERRAQPVCRHAARGAFSLRHARLHVQAVLDEIVAQAAFTDAPSGTGRHLLRLLLRLLLGLSSADSTKRPNDDQ